MKKLKNKLSVPHSIVSDKVKKLLLFPEAFFSVWALSRACGLSTRSILTPVLFLLTIYFFNHISLADSKNGAYKNRIRCFAGVSSAFFTVLFLLARSSALTEGLQMPLFRQVILLACGIGFFFLFYYILLFLYTYALKYTLAKEAKPVSHLPLLAFIVCLLGWLPYFLYEYPAVMTPDSINQLEQALGMIPYSNHHPWAHTMTLQFFYSLGCLFTEDRNAALAFFTVFQMCFMAFCVARLISALRKFSVKSGICLLIIAFYALTPYHAVFAVTIWKDVMFSGAVLLFSVSLLELLFLKKDSAKAYLPDIFLYILSGIMMCLFRTNGWYAFLISLPFLIYAFRQHIKILLAAHAPILAAVLFIKLVLMDSLGVIQPDFVESVSIPLQQVACVICQDRELTAEEWDSVHKVADTTYIKELYAPGFADNMKELVRAGNPNYLTAHKEEYLRLWVSLGLRYPADYLDAYISQTIGYWFPDVTYTVGDIDGIIPSETGVYSHPLIGGPVIVKIKEVLIKLGDMLPLYGLLFSMGAMFWALLINIAIVLLKKKYNRVVLFLPGLAVILTLFIATPVSSEFRYAYSLAYTLPLYLLLPFLRLPDSENTL